MQVIQKNPRSKKVAIFLISAQRKAVTSAIIFILLIFSPLGFYAIRSFVATSTKSIIETQKAYLNHLLITNDFVSINRLFYSLISPGSIAKISLTDLNYKTLVQVEGLQSDKQYSMSCHDSFEFAPSGTSSYFLNWTYQIPFSYFCIYFGAILGVALIVANFLRFAILNAGKKITEPVILLGDELARLDLNEPLQTEELTPFTSELEEFELLIGKYYQMRSRLFASEERVQILTQNEIYGKIASQVAHDIRSPLAALNMLLNQIHSLPEEIRLLMKNSIQRVNDIAQDLLEKSNKSKSILTTVELLTQIYLPDVLESIVSEKRIQFRQHRELTIELEIEDCYNAFIFGNSTDLKRVLSNLINNSVEAFSNHSGLIKVRLDKVKSNYKLSVVDNGRGIPKNILEKLGKVEISHGKKDSKSGFGLGFIHAKYTIEKFNGKIEIVSLENKGTTINIEFPSCEPPKWFIPQIQIQAGQIILALDDDQSVLGIWKQRFKELNYLDIKLLTLTSEIEFSEWISNNKELLPPSLFLMDYELLNQKQNGLDLIEKLNLSNAILVTSHYGEEGIQKRCESLNVQIVPKGMASQIPIEIIYDKIKYDAILIDDDDLIHSVWKLTAIEKNKSILCFNNEKDFLKQFKNIDLTTPIYIDVSLSDQVRGQDVAQRVYESGFKNIKLATGYDAESVDRPFFIKEVIGKTPPW